MKSCVGKSTLEQRVMTPVLTFKVCEPDDSRVTMGGAHTVAGVREAIQSQHLGAHLCKVVGCCRAKCTET